LSSPEDLGITDGDARGLGRTSSPGGFEGTHSPWGTRGAVHSKRSEGHGGFEGPGGHEGGVVLVLWMGTGSLGGKQARRLEQGQPGRAPGPGAASSWSSRSSRGPQFSVVSWRLWGPGGGLTTPGLEGEKVQSLRQHSLTHSLRLTLPEHSLSHTHSAYLGLARSRDHTLAALGRRSLWLEVLLVILQGVWGGGQVGQGEAGSSGSRGIL
jgi:hypothetical protein